MNEAISFFMSMLPISELRGGMIYASASGVPFIYAFPICLLGNILPIPFILLFIRQIFHYLERFKPMAKIVMKIESKARSKEHLIKKYELLGIFIFTAIPLPGTGAWTAALIAALLDIQIKRAFPALALGVLTAGIIMSIISFLLPGLFFSIL